MTIEYPIFLYKCPGAYVGSEGTSFSTEVANTVEESKVLQQNGYHQTMLDAIDVFKGKKAVIAESATAENDHVDERELLEQEAENLGIEVDRRWGLKTLKDKIRKAKEA
jgi:uncharacterized protein YraI